MSITRHYYTRVAFHSVHYCSRYFQSRMLHFRKFSVLRVGDISVISKYYVSRRQNHVHAKATPDDEMMCFQFVKAKLHSPYILGDTTRARHVTCFLVWSKSDQRRMRKTGSELVRSRF